MTQAAKSRESSDPIFKDAEAFSSFSVDDTSKAKKFYGKTLGLDVTESEEGLEIAFAGGAVSFAYPKENHEPATFTILNFPVADIEKAVNDLKDRGVEFESYDDPMKTDENGIFWGAKNGGEGPNIAWFQDPAGNILSVIEQK
jgi:predicted enzyme related to lactoylglutathione lyase